MFKILGQDGREYGPVGAETIRQWLAEGRVNPQTRVQAQGSAEWRLLADFPGLALPAVPAAAQAAPPAPRSGLALASLVLGILAFVLCAGPLLGLPAIVTGHLARGRARRAPAHHGGGGMALAGLILGYCNLLFLGAVLGLWILVRMSPGMARAQQKAQSIQCISNLKQIGLGARIYSNDHNNVFPGDFPAMSNELVSPKILCCPADKARTRATNWTSVTAANISYEFLTPGAGEPDVLKKPVFRCPIHRHVGMGDGSVERGDEPKPR